jgi:hypothetical protein
MRSRLRSLLALMSASCYGEHPALRSRQKSPTRGQRACCMAPGATLRSCMFVYVIASSCGALCRRSAAAVTATACNATATAGNSTDRSKH